MAAPSDEERRRRDRRALVAIAALVAVVVVVIAAVVLETGGADEPAEADHRGRAADGERAPVGRASAGHGPVVRDGGPAASALAPSDPAEGTAPAPPSPEPEPDDPGPGAEHIARYEGRSGRLSPHADLHGTRSTTPVRSHMAAPNVIAWVPTIAAVLGEEVPLLAVVVGNDDEPIEPSSIEATFFRDEPSDGVTIAMARAAGGAHHQWEAAYVGTAEAHPPGEDGAPPMARWLVRARGRYGGDEYSRSASGSFTLSSPGARLEVERAAAAREGDDLVVRVPVRIAQPGAYHGYAELWGGPEAATPIAFARDRVEYALAGTDVFVFLFGGAVIRERGEGGPYVVRNMRFMQVDSIPPHEQPPVEVVLTTPAWPASDFR